jgi:hypothetical protein
MMNTNSVDVPKEPAMSKAKLKGTTAIDPVTVGSADRIADRIADLSAEPGDGSASGHGFKFVLQRLTQPAIRLHRYRNVRTRMLQDALCDLDCGS